MILSIESSCDDSAIAITEIVTNKLLFHKKISQELERNIGR
jgi:N6-L-threonylcarbamoyladenine synthase